MLKPLDGGNLLVGEFQGPGEREAVLVVNKDLARSTAFGLEFKRTGEVKLVSPYSGAEAAIRVSNPPHDTRPQPEDP